MLSSANSTHGWTLRHPHVFSLEDLTCTNPEDIAPHQEHCLLVLGLDPDLPIEHGVEGVMGEPEGLLREGVLTACRKGGRQEVRRGGAPVLVPMRRSNLEAVH